MCIEVSILISVLLNGNLVKLKIIPLLKLAVDVMFIRNDKIRLSLLSHRNESLVNPVVLVR